MLKFLDEFFGYSKQKKDRWSKVNTDDAPSKCDDKDDHAITSSKCNPRKENLQQLADSSEAAFQMHLEKEANEKKVNQGAFSFTRLSKGELILGLFCFAYMLYRIFG